MPSLLSSLNPTPAFPAYSGPLQVGTCDVEIPVDQLQDAGASVPDPAVTTVSFRCFYPCTPPASSASGRPVRWIASPQRGIMAGYAKFLGGSDRFSDFFSFIPQLLYYITIPAHRNAPLLPSTNADERWPVVVFSHGLGGSRNAYTQLCGLLASHGLVVFAPEHRDGSSPITYVRETAAAPAHTVEYRSVSHKQCQTTYDARDEQLRIRLWELGLIHTALHKIDGGAASITNLDPNHGMKSKKALPVDVLGQFKGRLSIHEPGSVTFAGHSFGAVTTIQLVKSVFYSSRPSNQIFTPIYPASAPSSLASQITPSTPTILLDLWGLPLESTNTSSINSLPHPCFSAGAPTGAGSAVLAIMSEAFFNWKANLRSVKRALTDPEPKAGRAPAHLFYPLRSAHLSQSDFGILFPNVTKYLAKADEPARTLRLNARAILQVLRGGGVPVSGVTAADLEGEHGPASQAVEEVEDDARVLSTAEGIVRGWVAVPVVMDAEEVEKEAEREREKELRDAGVRPRPGDEAVGGDELAGEKKGAVINGGKI